MSFLGVLPRHARKIFLPFLHLEILSSKQFFVAPWIFPEDQFESEGEEDGPFEDKDLVPYQSDVVELDSFHREGEEEEEEKQVQAGMGSGWGRIIYMPLRRGRQVQMDVCRATKRDGSEGSFERVVVTQNKNPVLHHQARRSIWGDLWPF